MIGLMMFHCFVFLSWSINFFKNTLKMHFIHTYSVFNTKTEKSLWYNWNESPKKSSKAQKPQNLKSTSCCYTGREQHVTIRQKTPKNREPIIVSDPVYTGCGVIWRENDATLYVWCTLRACVTSDNSTNGSGTIVASGVDMVLFVIDPTKPTMEQRKCI